uniref:OBP47-like domain-containing protein n=1 Tax=Anopheles minimus TaxID=112268 RepID=A0A3F2Z0Y3_9DIPT
MLLIVCVWLIRALLYHAVHGQMYLELAEITASPFPEEIILSCREMFHLYNPRNCCRIPHLLQPNVLEPCLNAPQRTSDNCRAECVLNHTQILLDGHFQIEIAKSVLTNAISEDSQLTDHIQNAITKCQAIHFLPSITPKWPDTCKQSAWYFLDCVFAITYRNCPLQYWTKANECRRLVRALHECSYFLVHSDKF